MGAIVADNTKSIFALCGTTTPPPPARDIFALCGSVKPSVGPPDLFNKNGIVVKEEEVEEDDETYSPVAVLLKEGITPFQLAELFNIQVQTIRKNISPVSPIRTSKKSNYYAFRQVIPYLTTPVKELNEYLKTAKVEDLPLRYQNMHWNSLEKEREYKEKIGELWRTDEALLALANAFKILKMNFSYWPSKLTRDGVLPPELNDTLIELFDDLLKQIYDDLAKSIQKSATRSMLSVFEKAAVEREQ